MFKVYSTYKRTTDGINFNLLILDTTVPTTFVPGKKMDFFPPLPGFFPLFPGKIFFFPTILFLPWSLHTKLGEASRREEKTCHHYYFRPRPPRPDRTPSPSAAHRTETTPFVQLFPPNPIYLPPHRRRFNPTADAVLRYSDTTSPSF